jgi:hypothetical protein
MRYFSDRSIDVGVLLGFTVLFAVACSNPVLGQEVGVTAATNPVATGEPPGQGLRELKIGANVVRNERIRTTVDGATQVIFVDRTSLTIGPNSDITINEYVYNPGGNSGNLAVRVGNGVLRFIGGEISHSDQIRITTPTATLGIRGGMVIVENSHGKTRIVHLYGTTIVTSGGNSLSLSKPGLYVEANGHIISKPIPVPPGLLAFLNSRLGSKQGQTGGTRTGWVTSNQIRQYVTNSEPYTRNNPSQGPSQGPSQEQLQFIVAIRPQLESISNSNTVENNESDDDDDDHDRHHHHRHRHDHDHDHDHHHDHFPYFDRYHHDHDGDRWVRLRFDHHPPGHEFPGYFFPGHSGPCLAACGHLPGGLGIGHHHP